MAKRFSRRLLFGYSVNNVESYIQQQADNWKQECAIKDLRIQELEKEVARLSEQLRLRGEQDADIIQALAHAERMGKTEQKFMPDPVLDKSETQKRVDEAIRLNMESLKALKERLDKTAPILNKTFSANAPNGESADAKNPIQALGLGAAFPGEDVSDIAEGESPDWQGMLRREYELEAPVLSGFKHEQLEELTRELGIE